MVVLNDMQRAVLKDYANGMYDGEEIQDIMRLGDTLLSFILLELSEEEDCEDLEQGIDRLRHGRDDIDVALKALEKLQEAIASKMVKEGSSA